MKPAPGEVPRIDSVRYYKANRPAPQAGDRRVTKKHGLEIRVHVRAKDFKGQPIGFRVSNGRPIYQWCAPKWLEPWDRHWLTSDEMARYFPPGREPGYMQGRGAA
jgi:hypothetical protein